MYLWAALLVVHAARESMGAWLRGIKVWPTPREEKGKRHCCEL